MTLPVWLHKSHFYLNYLSCSNDDASFSLENLPYPLEDLPFPLSSIPDENDLKFMDTSEKIFDILKITNFFVLEMKNFPCDLLDNIHKLRKELNNSDTFKNMIGVSYFYILENKEEYVLSTGNINYMDEYFTKYFQKKSYHPEIKKKIISNIISYDCCEMLKFMSNVDLGRYNNIDLFLHYCIKYSSIKSLDYIINTYENEIDINSINELIKYCVKCSSNNCFDYLIKKYNCSNLVIIDLKCHFIKKCFNHELLLKFVKLLKFDQKNTLQILVGLSNPTIISINFSNIIDITKCIFEIIYTNSTIGFDWDNFMIYVFYKSIKLLESDEILNIFIFYFSDFLSRNYIELFFYCMRNSKFNVFKKMKKINYSFIITIESLRQQYFRNEYYSVITAIILSCDYECIEYIREQIFPDFENEIVKNIEEFHYYLDKEFLNNTKSISLKYIDYIITILNLDYQYFLKYIHYIVKQDLNDYLYTLWNMENSKQKDIIEKLLAISFFDQIKFLIKNCNLDNFDKYYFLYHVFEYFSDKRGLLEILLDINYISISDEQIIKFLVSFCNIEILNEAFVLNFTYDHDILIYSIFNCYDIDKLNFLIEIMKCNIPMNFYERLFNKFSSMMISHQ